MLSTVAIKWVLVATMSIGTIGNSLIIAAILTMRRHATFYVYLLILAVADLLALYTTCVRKYLIAVLKSNIELIDAYACRLFPFVNLTAVHFAVWTLCLLTLDRMLHIAWPLMTKRLCSTKRALMTLTVAFFVICALNSPFLWMQEDLSTAGNTSDPCHLPEQYLAYFYLGYHWQHFAVYSFLPLAVIISANIKIIHSMCASAMMVAPSANSSRRNGKQDQMSANRWQKLRKSIAILLPTSMSLLITTLPQTITYIYRDLVYGSDAPSDIFLSLLHFTEILAIQNHVINFVIYGVVGASFRTHLFKICGWCSRARRRIARHDARERRRPCSSGADKRGTDETLLCRASDGAPLSRNSQEVSSGASCKHVDLEPPTRNETHMSDSVDLHDKNIQIRLVRVETAERICSILEPHDESAVCANCARLPSIRFRPQSYIGPDSDLIPTVEEVRSYRPVTRNVQCLGATPCSVDCVDGYPGVTTATQRQVTDTWLRREEPGRMSNGNVFCGNGDCSGQLRMSKVSTV